MRTIFLLVELYGKVVLPLDRVCEDFFSPMTLATFTRKLNIGDIPIPVIRYELSQKTPRGIHVDDLADYIDLQRQEAKRELRQMLGPGASRRRHEE